ncbi:MAG TPA: hypothetical protein VF691_04680, partial [Cytophagaceae bacterium]
MSCTYTNIIFSLFSLLAFSQCTPDGDRVFIPTSHNINHVHNFYADAEKLTYSVEYGFINLGNIEIATDPELVYVGDIRCHHVGAHCE